MPSFVIPPPPVPAVPVAGGGGLFPVHRIYCVGRNYAEHAREMGADPTREAPFFFQKPADAVLPADAELPYPPHTADLHHEVELVVAIGTGGRDVPVARALDHVYGYAVGNDWTRRDLQAAAKKQGRPWDTAKGFDASAGLAPLHAVAQVGHPDRGRIWLTVNEQPRQQGDLADLIWSVPEIVAELSTLFALAPGDLIYTGTPAGVGAVQPGDVVVAGIDGLGTLRTVIGAPRKVGAAAA